MSHELKVEQVEQTEDKKAILDKVKTEIGLFEEFFTGTLGNGPLSPYEKSVLGTFLVWALGLKMK